jgi:hypothetical protein
VAVGSLQAAAGVVAAQADGARRGAKSAARAAQLTAASQARTEAVNAVANIGDPNRPGGPW